MANESKIVNESGWLPEKDAERMLVEDYGMSLDAAREWLHNKTLPRKLVDIPDSELPQHARWQRVIAQLGFGRPDVSYRHSVVSAAALADQAGELHEAAPHGKAIRDVLKAYRAQEHANPSKHRAWKFAQPSVPPGTTRVEVWAMYEDMFGKRNRGRPSKVTKY